MFNGITQRRPKSGAVILALILSLATGCAKQSVKGQVPVVKVRGIVKIDGKPSSRAMLQASPVDATKGLPGASASVSEDGSFVFQTYAPGDGIPKGSFKVTLGPDFAKFQPIPAVSPVVIEVTEANSKMEIDFKSGGKGTIGLPPPGMEKAQ